MHTHTHISLPWVTLGKVQRIKCEDIPGKLPWRVCGKWHPVETCVNQDEFHSLPDIPCRCSSVLRFRLHLRLMSDKIQGKVIVKNCCGRLSTTRPGGILSAGDRGSSFPNWLPKYTLSLYADKTPCVLQPTGTKRLFVGMDYLYSTWCSRVRHVKQRGWRDVEWRLRLANRHNVTVEHEWWALVFFCILGYSKLIAAYHLPQNNRKRTFFLIKHIPTNSMVGTCILWNCGHIKYVE